MRKTVLNQTIKPRNCLSLKEKCRAIELLKEKRVNSLLRPFLEWNKQGWSGISQASWASSS